jgi:DNA-binding transcriptional LysR family regulator
VTEFRDKPAGTIRITATDYATKTVLWPRLSKVLRKYPEIKVEIMTDYGLSDIVADRYDIGVRNGDQVARDMIAVRIAPDMRMAIVGSPGYLAERELPRKPQDLTAHNCINLRLPTLGGFYPWELKKGTRAVQARVEGQFAFNGTYQMLDAALSGCGLAYVPADLVQAHVAAGRLIRVLEDWCPTFPGLHAYYANRREFSRAMTVVIDALRYRPEDTKR